MQEIEGLDGDIDEPYESGVFAYWGGLDGLDNDGDGWVDRDDCDPNFPDCPRTAADFNPTIEYLNTFPEKFVGRDLVFTNCRISHEVERVRGRNYFCLAVTSKGGEYIVPMVGGGDIAFVVSSKLAEKMAQHFSGGSSWPNCAIACTVEKKDLEGDDATVAVVNKLQVYNRGGQLSLEFEE